MSDDCIHGLGPVAACVICNGRAEREEHDGRRVVARFIAKFPGTRCHHCDGDIEIGDRMGRTADDYYVCECSL